MVSHLCTCAKALCVCIFYIASQNHDGFIFNRFVLKFSLVICLQTQKTLQNYKEQLQLCLLRMGQHLHVNMEGFSQSCIVYDVCLCLVCQRHYSEGLVWEKLEVNQLSRIYCASLHSSFHSEVFITRYCYGNREWGNVDFSSCTMRPDADLLVMTEIRGNTTTAENAPSVINNVSDNRCIVMWLSSCASR